MELPLWEKRKKASWPEFLPRLERDGSIQPEVCPAGRKGKRSLYSDTGWGEGIASFSHERGEEKKKGKGIAFDFINTGEEGEGKVRQCSGEGCLRSLVQRKRKRRCAISVSGGKRDGSRSIGRGGAEGSFYVDQERRRRKKRGGGKKAAQALSRRVKKKTLCKKKESRSSAGSARDLRRQGKGRRVHLTFIYEEER